MSRESIKEAELVQESSRTEDIERETTASNSNEQVSIQGGSERGKNWDASLTASDTGENNLENTLT